MYMKYKLYKIGTVAHNYKEGGVTYESETFFKGFYVSCDRADHLAVWKCHVEICAAFVSAEPDRVVGAIRDGDGVRFYPVYYIVAGGRHRGGQSQ